ncbi:hypothetical protein B7486_16685 [cyanobacterium TDX16]|nr:hypothetical protein B7486_16685 [cyanobacterium TDX16]
MAIATSDDAAGGAASRRFSIGANVTLAIILAAVLIVAVNWFASIKNVRRDLASYGNYGLSGRTKNILQGCTDPVSVSMVYMPDEADEKQQSYIDRLQDYLEEMTRFSTKVQVDVVATDSQREKLVSRISSTFGGEAESHKEALSGFASLSAELTSELQQRLVSAQALMSESSWIGAFPVFGNIVATMKADLETLKKSGEEIAELTPQGGIPKYADATAKAKTALADVKGHMQAIEKRLGDLASLAGETSKPDSRYITTLRKVASDAKSLVATLRNTVGPESAPVPSDAAAALKAFADRGTEIGTSLDQLVQQVDEFARSYPMVTQHPSWAASVQMGPLVTRMEVADVLAQAGQTLSKARLVILGIIDSGKQNELQQALREARSNCTVLEKNASICEELLTNLANSLSSVDAGSLALLDAGKNNSLFTPRIAAIDELDKRITDLPELKLGSVADQLKQPNTIVIETGSKIRVVSFAEVWPVRESIGGPGAKPEDANRTFNGDSAISSALLSMTQKGPFATVVLTAFEPPAPEQRNQFMPPPPQSWVPLGQLSELRKRLEAANFKVIDWNMATTKEAPKPDEGTQSVYVLLPPPPPAPPNPFGQSQPPDQAFGEPQRATIKELLDSDAKVLFLASWEVRAGGFFGGPPATPPYGYGPLLDSEWGIEVDNSRRITWLDPYRAKENSYQVVPPKFIHMPAAGFTDSPIGSPLRGTRFLVTDACPLEKKSELPSGVSLKTVMSIPDTQNYIGASMAELMEIIERVQDPGSQGIITLTNPPVGGPFDVMLTGERVAEGKSKGKLVVMGFGASIRDDYLTQPVVAESQQLRLDPPPTENADLFVNALYWLSGQPELISRGPVPVPRIEQIASSEMRVLGVLVWAVWPVVIFLPGIIAWAVRRR